MKISFENFQVLYPDVEIYLAHSQYHIIEQALKKGEIDCGFISSRHRENCDFIPLIKDEYFVVLPHEHPLWKYEAIPLEALEDEKIILMNDGDSFGSTYYDTANILSKISIQSKYVVEDDFVALALVGAGLGITILPKLVLDCTTTSAVVKPFAVPKYRTLGIAVKDMKTATPLTKLFINTVTDYVNSITL